MFFSFVFVTPIKGWTGKYVVNVLDKGKCVRVACHYQLLEVCYLPVLNNHHYNFTLWRVGVRTYNVQKRATALEVSCNVIGNSFVLGGNNHKLLRMVEATL